MLFFENLHIRWIEWRDKRTLIFPHEYEILKGRNKMTLGELLNRFGIEDTVLEKKDRNLVVKIEYLDDELFDVAGVEFNHENHTVILEVD